MHSKSPRGKAIHSTRVTNTAPSLRPLFRTRRRRTICLVAQIKAMRRDLQMGITMSVGRFAVGESAGTSWNVSITGREYQCA